MVGEVLQFETEELLDCDGECLEVAQYVYDRIQQRLLVAHRTCFHLHYQRIQHKRCCGCCNCCGELWLLVRCVVGEAYTFILSELSC